MCVAGPRYRENEADSNGLKRAKKCSFANNDTVSVCRGYGVEMTNTSNARNCTDKGAEIARFAYFARPHGAVIMSFERLSLDA